MNNAFSCLLINQQALIHAHLTPSNHISGNKAIDLSTYGVLFLGTPHQGSDSASLAKFFINVLSVVKKTNDALVKHIRKDSEALRVQLDQYSLISERFNTKFFYETYPTPLVGGIEQLVRSPVFMTEPSSSSFVTDCSKVLCSCSGCNQRRIDSSQQGPCEHGKIWV